MSCLWILLFFTLCPYIHLGRAGQDDRGHMTEPPPLSKLLCSSACARMPWCRQSALADLALQQATSCTSAQSCSWASNSWKLILWLFWISQQLLSIHDKLLTSIQEQRLVSALPVSLLLEKSKIRIYNRRHYKGVINLSGTQIVSR